MKIIRGASRSSDNKGKTIGVKRLKNVGVLIMSSQSTKDHRI